MEMLYKRLYKTCKEIEIFICSLKLYIEMKPGIVEDFVPSTAKNVETEMIVETIEHIK